MNLKIGGVMFFQAQNLEQKSLKIKKNWWYSTLSLYGAYNFFFLSLFNCMGHKRELCNELLFGVILGLFINILWFILFYQPSIKKSGMVLLFLSVFIISPFNLINTAVNFYILNSGMLSLSLISIFIGLHVWWYYSSFKLQKLKESFA